MAIFPGTFLLLSFLLAGENPSAESSRGYRMYRNPPKPRLALLPTTGTLDSASRAALDSALAGAAKELKDLRILILPAASAPGTARRPNTKSLTSLGRRHAVDLFLRAHANRKGDSLVLEAAVLDARTAAVRTTFRSACRCGPDSLAAAAREGVRALSRAPRMRGFRCGERMALIPAADDASGKTSAPGFCIDLYEFPNQVAGEPMVGRTWDEAAAACADQGKRLCSETEWSLACGGPEALDYPYGYAYSEDRCNTSSRTIRLSGSYDGCRSPYKVHDLSGNVYEWTSSNWNQRVEDKVVKGGNWNAGAENSSCKARFGQTPSAPSPAIGFRCCLTLEGFGYGSQAEVDPSTGSAPSKESMRRGSHSR